MEMTMKTESCGLALFCTELSFIHSNHDQSSRQVTSNAEAVQLLNHTFDNLLWPHAAYCLDAAVDRCR